MQLMTLSVLFVLDKELLEHSLAVWIIVDAHDDVFVLAFDFDALVKLELEVLDSLAQFV